MARLLMDWLQIHPGLPRIQAHSAQAGPDAGDNHNLGRPWLPEHDIDIEALDARLAASPASSVADLLTHVAALVTQDTGLHCDAQEPPPPTPTEDAEPAP